MENIVTNPTRTNDPLSMTYNGISQLEKSTHLKMKKVTQKTFF